MRIDLEIPKVDEFGNEVMTNTVVDYSFEDKRIVINTVWVDYIDQTDRMTDLDFEKLTDLIGERLL